MANGSPFFSSKKNILRIVKIIFFKINKNVGRHFSMEDENIRSHVLGGNERGGLLWENRIKRKTFLWSCTFLSLFYISLNLYDSLWTPLG